MDTVVDLLEEGHPVSLVVARRAELPLIISLLSGVLVEGLDSDVAVEVLEEHLVQAFLNRSVPGF